MTKRENSKRVDTPRPMALGRDLDKQSSLEASKQIERVASMGGANPTVTDKGDTVQPRNRSDWRRESESV